MGAFSEELTVELALVVDQFKRGMARAEKTVVDFAKEGVRAGRKFNTSFVKAIKDGSVRVTKQITKMRKGLAELGKLLSDRFEAAEINEFARSLSRAASEFEEIQVRARLAFGESAQAAEQFALDLSRSVGTSRTELLGLLSDTQALFVNLGVGRKEAAGFSQQMASLAVDLAAANTSIKTAGQASLILNDALTGSNDVLQDLGILITETAVNEELLAMGIAGGTKAATAQETVMARLNLIMKGSKEAIGAAAEQSRTLAGQMKILKGAVEEVKIILGQELNKALLSTVKDLGGAQAASLKLVKVTRFLQRGFLLVKLGGAAAFRGLALGVVSVVESFGNLDKLLRIGVGGALLQLLTPVRFLVQGVRALAGLVPGVKFAEEALAGADKFLADIEASLAAEQQSNIEALSFAGTLETVRQLTAGIRSDRDAVADVDAEILQLDKQIKTQAEGTAAATSDIAASTMQAVGATQGLANAMGEAKANAQGFVKFTREGMAILNNPNVKFFSASAVEREGQRRQFGGLVTGGGSVTDSVPLVARRGEFVLRPEAVRALGPDLLSRLNRAERPISVNQTFNLGGGGQGGAREQARQMAAQVDRAARRGITRGLSFA